MELSLSLMFVFCVCLPFAARVYAILAVQLLVTGTWVILFGTVPFLRQWVKPGGGGSLVPITSLIVSTISFTKMAMDPVARRKSPQKWWYLGFFTLGEAISVGFISSFYTLSSVLSALLATMTATMTVSLYTIMQKNPNYDLTLWGTGLSSYVSTIIGCLMSCTFYTQPPKTCFLLMLLVFSSFIRCLMIFLFYGIIGILQMSGILPATFLPYNDAIYGCLGATLFSMFLAHHTKLITAGKHAKYRMKESDYVLGAMTLFSDIINMFIYLLRVIGEDRDR